MLLHTVLCRHSADFRCPFVCRFHHTYQVDFSSGLGTHFHAPKERPAEKLLSVKGSSTSHLSISTRSVSPQHHELHSIYHGRYSVVRAQGSAWIEENPTVSVSIHNHGEGAMARTWALGSCIYRIPGSFDGILRMRFCLSRSFQTQVTWIDQRYALESGVTTINGKIAKPDTIIKNGDRIECVAI